MCEREKVICKKLEGLINNKQTEITFIKKKSKCSKSNQWNSCFKYPAQRRSFVSYSLFAKYLFCCHQFFEAPTNTFQNNGWQMVSYTVSYKFFRIQFHSISSVFFFAKWIAFKKEIIDNEILEFLYNSYKNITLLNWSIIIRTKIAEHHTSCTTYEVIHIHFNAKLYKIIEGLMSWFKYSFCIRSM